MARESSKRHLGPAAGFFQRSGAALLWGIGGKLCGSRVDFLRKLQAASCLDRNQVQTRVRGCLVPTSKETADPELGWGRHTALAITRRI